MKQALIALACSSPDTCDICIPVSGVCNTGSPNVHCVLILCALTGTQAVLACVCTPGTGRSSKHCRTAAAAQCVLKAFAC